MIEIVPDDVAALKAAFRRVFARLGAEARASGAEAMVVHLKLLIAKLKRERFGPSSEQQRRLLDLITRRHAGATPGASSLCWPTLPRRRWLLKRSAGSTPSSMPSAPFAA